MIKNVMLKDTVDGEFTTTDDVADAVLFFAGVPNERAHRPVARRQPRLVHAVAVAAQRFAARDALTRDAKRESFSQTRP